MTKAEILAILDQYPDDVDFVIYNGLGHVPVGSIEPNIDGDVLVIYPEL